MPDLPDTTPTPKTLSRRLLCIPTPRRLIILILCTYIGVVMLAALFQSKLVYFPSRSIETTPSQFGLQYDDIILTTSDGVKISAWFVPCLDARATVLFLHGNAGNNGDRIPELKTLNSLRFNTLVVDYRGFGKSEGNPTELGTYADAVAAWDHLTQTRNIPPQSIVILGESIGGAVAIDLARRVKPGALIVQSTFTRLTDVAAHHYPLLPVRWILRYRYDSIDKVGAITCPKLFFHGAEDTQIPLVQGKSLFNAAADPKKFIETPGNHNDGGFMFSQEYANLLRDFIDSAVSPHPKP